MGVLRDRMIEEMKLRNFSTATQESYVYAVSRLVRYHNKSPDQLSKEDIRAFLVHLTIERKLSPNSLTGYCSGYFMSTVGQHGNEESIKKYIEGQGSQYTQLHRQQLSLF